MANELKPSPPERTARNAAGGLSIVVPVFNEEGGLVALHERIGEVARRLSTRGLRCEVIYVVAGRPRAT